MLCQQTSCLGPWHQEVGCLLNQAEVNMPCEEKGGNIPQIERGGYVWAFSQQENKATHTRSTRTDEIKGMNK